MVFENFKLFSLIYSRDEVTSFGLWQESGFNVMPGTDVKKLYNALQTIDRDFFSRHVLEIENKKFIEKLTMGQGSFVLSNPNMHQFSKGTLGGFVTRPDNTESKFGLTCNHIFPMTNLRAYDGDPPHLRDIGRCVFTTRERHCDFAAIEINESVSAQCNITFKRDDGELTNAHVYEGKLENIGILHKIGAGSGVTNGTIFSEEYYVKRLIDDDNKDSVFLVRGTGGRFSEEGDSGSLVFARPRQAAQNYVNVIGMVSGNNVVVKYDDKNDATSLEKQLVTDESDPERISTCFRITIALDLMKKRQRIPVKFKDDLPSSSSSSSSDDSS